MDTEKLNIILDKFTGKCREKFKDNLVSIVLFGSYARGTATKYSDIDLLVIAEGLPKRRIDRYEDIFDILLSFTEKYQVSVSPVLLEPKDLSVNFINPLIYGVLTGHKIIYDKNNFWKKYLISIKPKILEKEPIYIERNRRWKIAEII